MKLIFLDFDDTISCSSWTTKVIVANDVKDERSFLKLKESINKQTVTLEEKALNLIKIAEREGILVIISNAEYEWITYILINFLPKLNDYLNDNKIEIVSARDLFQSMHPTDPIQWKVKCFRQQINLKMSKIIDRKKIMIISIGDGLFERIACRDIAYELNLPYCSLKLLESPNPVSLSNQLELISSCFGELVEYPPNREQITRSNIHDRCNDLYFDYNTDGYLCIYHWEKAVDKKSIEVEKSCSDCLTNSELQDDILTKTKSNNNIESKNDDYVSSQDSDSSLEEILNKKLSISDDSSAFGKSEDNIININNNSKNDYKSIRINKKSNNDKKYNNDDTSDEESDVEVELEFDMNDLDKLNDLLSSPSQANNTRNCDSRNSNVSEFSGYTDHTRDSSVNHSRNSSIDCGNRNNNNKVLRTISNSSMSNTPLAKVVLKNIFEDEEL